MLGIGLLAGGLIARWAALAGPGAGITVLVVVCGCWAARRPAVDLDREVRPERVTKGGAAQLMVRAVNRGRRPLRAVVLEQRVGTSVVQVRLNRVARGQEVHHSFALPTSQRGEFTIPPAEAVRADAFGLWRRVQRLGAPQRLTVTPRVVPLPAMPVGLSRLVEGPASDTAPQGSTTFHRLRPYVVGDDLRKVHWRSTARLGSLVVRQDVDTSQPSTAVLVDLRPGVHTARGFEEAVDLAASVVVASSAGRAPVTFFTTSGARLTATGGSVGAVLDWLARAHLDDAGSTAAALARIAGERATTTLLVVTGTPDGTSLRAAASVSRRYQTLVVAAVTNETVPAYPGVTTLAAPDLDRMQARWQAAALRRVAPAGGRR